MERFHQGDQPRVWDRTALSDPAAVQRHSAAFPQRYRGGEHHSALQGRSPVQRHLASRFPKLPPAFEPPGRLPLTAGRAHSIRRVGEARQIALLKWLSTMF